MSQMDEYTPILIVVSALLAFLLFYMEWHMGQYLLLLFDSAGLIYVYIGGWAREVVKKRRTVSRTKVNLAVSILFLATAVWIIGSAYAIYVGQLHFFPYLHLIAMAIVFWVCGCITYTLLKRKLVPNRIYIPVVLILVVLFFALFGLHFY